MTQDRARQLLLETGGQALRDSAPRLLRKHPAWADCSAAWWHYLTGACSSSEQAGQCTRQYWPVLQALSTAPARPARRALLAELSLTVARLTAPDCAAIMAPLAIRRGLYQRARPRRGHCISSLVRLHPYHAGNCRPIARRRRCISTVSRAQKKRPSSCRGIDVLSGVSGRVH
jgi:hypothetical protein